MAVTQAEFERRLVAALDKANFDLSKRDVQDILEVIGDTIETSLAQEMKEARKLGWAKKAKTNGGMKAKNPVVVVRGIGRFGVNAYPARMGRNPQTGDTIKIAPSQRMRVRPHKALKEALGVK